MAKRFLVTRPRHDIPTEYLHAFAQQTIKTAKADKTMHVTDLEGDSATRENLEQALKKEQPGLIFLNGHGNKRVVYGHKDEEILDEKNIVLAKGSLIYALACDSLEELGPAAIDAGAKAYIGYKESFMIIRDLSRLGSPNKDKNALPFKSACTVLLKSLMDGQPAQKAIDLTRQEYVRQIKSFGTSEDDAFGDTPLIRFALAWNLEFLDMCGNPDAAFC